MRLILGVSADGYLAREKNDRMDWLGPTDKQVFRILTGVGSVCGVSAKSAALMPKTLPGRQMQIISRSGDDCMTLVEFANRHQDGWLLGGPTLAMAALEMDLLAEVHICRSSRYAYPDCMRAGVIGDCVTRYLKANQRFPGAKSWWHLGLETPIGDLKVERWKRWKSYEQQGPRE
ncbi:dihydrofolate reductase [Roseobacter phage RDJL Phi 2]|uniref:Dihydrofolate reductase n=1 Tax=Roseobacter phage RDJL Phi 2 TaxID=1682380 RepID=A0A0K0PVD9_9CAUD|nr:dihydrofolate reductase [Roseobacter phage RDJL Phi 2]AKQ75802.1 dihydrofolate reductase [Roseobacter phage RDJL Phi 2]